MQPDFSAYFNIVEYQKCQYVINADNLRKRALSASHL